MDRVDRILFENGLTIRHYGWVCIAASHTNVSTYDFAGRFDFGEAPKQGHIFCDLVQQHLKETCTVEQFVNVCRELREHDACLLVGAGNDVVVQRPPVQKLWVGCTLMDVLDTAERQVAGQFYSALAYSAIEKAEMAEWQALQELDDHSYQNVGSLLQDLMLFMLEIAKPIIKWTDVAGHKDRLNTLSGNYNVSLPLMNAMSYSACLFLQGFGFGVLSIGLPSEVRKGGRKPWFFSKCKIAIGSWPQHPCGLGIVALGLHVGSNPSIRTCQSAANASIIRASECRDCVWHDEKFGDCLQLLGLSCYADCNEVLDEHKEILNVELESQSAVARQQSRMGRCLQPAAVIDNPYRAPYILPAASKARPPAPSTPVRRNDFGGLGFGDEENSPLASPVPMDLADDSPSPGQPCKQEKEELVGSSAIVVPPRKRVASNSESQHSSACPAPHRKSRLRLVRDTPKDVPEIATGDPSSRGSTDWDRLAADVVTRDSDQWSVGGPQCWRDPKFD